MYICFFFVSWNPEHEHVIGVSLLYSSTLLGARTPDPSLWGVFVPRDQNSYGAFLLSKSNPSTFFLSFFSVKALTTSQPTEQP